MSQALCKVSEIGENGKEVVIHGDNGAVYIMLFNHHGGIKAFLNVCPHQGRPLNLAPDRFLFTPEGLLMCPHHGASFQLESGECVAGPCSGSLLRPVNVSIGDETVCLAARVESLTDES